MLMEKAFDRPEAGALESPGDLETTRSGSSPIRALASGVPSRSDQAGRTT
jgi:hypothetical protein